MTFFYRFQKSAAPDTIFWLYGFQPGSQLITLTESPAYKKQVYCLDPTRAGHAATFGINGGTDGNPSPCGRSIAPQTLHVDDVTVGTDPGCPVQ